MTPGSTSTSGCWSARPGRSTGPGRSRWSTPPLRHLEARRDRSTAAVPPPTGPAGGSPRSAARVDSHRLRAQCDVVLVGTGTVEVDDPQLTVRDEYDEPARPPAAARRDGAARPGPRPTESSTTRRDRAAARPATRAEALASAARRATGGTSSSRAGPHLAAAFLARGAGRRGGGVRRAHAARRRARNAVADLGIGTIADIAAAADHRRDHRRHRRRRQRPHSTARPREGRLDVHRHRRGARHRRGPREDQGDAVRLTVRGPLVTGDAALGDSISVNGCCLTVATHEDDAVHRGRDARDPRQDLARCAGAGHAGQPGARGHPGHPARRPHRPGPRRRHRRRASGVRPASTGRSWRSSLPAEPRALPGRQGVDHRRRHLADRRRGRARTRSR